MATFKINQIIRTKVPTKVRGKVVKPNTRCRVMAPVEIDPSKKVRALVIGTEDVIVMSHGAVRTVSRGRPRKDGSPARKSA
jgi:hypothetical protein